MASLPEDVIFEILTRVSLQTLGRCKMVSPTWNRITYEPSFTDIHPSRSETALGYFIQNWRYGHVSYPSYVSLTDGGPHLSLSFLPRSVEIVACDRGILLCIKGRGDKKYNYAPEYHVCKPTTKEFTKIPNPKTKYFTENIAMVVSKMSPLKYKIIRVSNQRDSRFLHRMMRCEIFDSDTRKWKRLSNLKLPYDRIIGCHQNPIVVGDEVVWFASYDYNFLVFNMLKETWEIIPMSLDAYDEPSSRMMRMTKHEGKLCMMQTTDDNAFVNIWTMENWQWKKKRMALFGKNSKKTEYLGFPVALKNTDVAIFKSSYMLRLYNFSSCTSKTLTADVDSASNVFFSCSDFEPCNIFGLV